jgi:hypothetical protein
LLKKVDTEQTAAVLIGAAATPDRGGAGEAQANSDSTIANPAITVGALARMIISQADRGAAGRSKKPNAAPLCVDL